MIEPHSAQLGASAWAWKLTFVPPRLSVIGAALPPGLPLPFPRPLAVWPFVASTLSASPEAVSGASRPIVAVADAVGRSGSAWSGST